MKTSTIPKSVVGLAVAAVCLLPSATWGSFASPASEADRPETWYHIIGGNATRQGITADLEALKAAGIGGIQFFHGQFGPPAAWDGVSEQIPCLSEKWDGLVTHAADECARLDLTFKMQNCPGWSMSGGPWIAPSNAMRKLVYVRRELAGGPVPGDIPIPERCRDADSDWHDLFLLAFPTPAGDTAAGPLKPLSTVRRDDGRFHEFRFAAPVTIRTLELPSPRALASAWSYNPATRVTFEAAVDGGWTTVCAADYPQGCWQDGVPMSLACTERTAQTWRLRVESPHHPVRVDHVRLLSGARLDNWEGQAGHVLRGLIRRPYPLQSAAAYIPTGSVRVVQAGEALPEGSRWTVLRVGHVNMKKVNAPAPKEATGWECDKMDPRGIEANFAAYIGRLAQGPLKGGKLKGMVVDSWECERQTWTWRMEERFRAANGFDVRTMLPAVFGWVIGSPAETESLLLTWRRTLAGLVTANYYARMAELAHEAGLTVAYETAFGDVLPGDPLEYWKHCDTPMCEFWQPYSLEAGGTGHPNYKPVKPCVSAAHLYAKPRVACEAFTNTALTWDECFRPLKEQAVRHFARGVTHLILHTCTHNPQTDARVPGTSFGSFIGTPFIRGQTWWPFMRPFTDWIAACGAFLERGLPVVDVLRYLGDDLDHKPDELEPFPYGFKCDYLNADALFSRLDVADGRFVLPGGMSYAAIWLPDGVRILPKTRARLDELAAKGGRIVRGSAAAAVKGMVPQFVAAPSHLLWYHRRDADEDGYFVAADEKGFTGTATFRTQEGPRTLTLQLAPFETMLLAFAKGMVRDLAPQTLHPHPAAEVPARVCAAISPPSGWTLSFPPGWGAPPQLALAQFAPWRALPGVSAEGRAFSGTASYMAAWTLPERIPSPLLLDLGEVRDFARVYVNGREAAALWAAPYRCDVAPFVRPGENEIRVEVTSTWFNRLAYDFAQPAANRKTWTVWDVTPCTPPCLMPDAPLRDSGLLGPVSVWTTSH